MHGIEIGYFTVYLAADLLLLIGSWILLIAVRYPFGARNWIKFSGSMIGFIIGIAIGFLFFEWQVQPAIDLILQVQQEHPTQFNDWFFLVANDSKHQMILLSYLIFIIATPIYGLFIGPGLFNHFIEWIKEDE